MNITDICQDLHNYFEEDSLGRSKSMKGTFTITGGVIDLGDFIPAGQYFRILGSNLNEGAHRYGDNDLEDETFDGEVRAMWVPTGVMVLMQDMNDWENKYGDAYYSPFSSESFGGYSYSKAGGAGNLVSGANGQVTGVYAVFADRLNRWRKV